MKNLNEVMVEYSEMSGFDFNLLKDTTDLVNEYSNHQYTFKYGNYDMLDMLICYT